MVAAAGMGSIVRHLLSCWSAQHRFNLTYGHPWFDITPIVTNGVWLISADGTKQLLHFTTENSPIPNNNINDINVDQQTGEVWIGTVDGLVSYQGDAILGASTKGQALVYPNPVRPNYSGPIAIKGLVDNAYVKITDAAGILVYQGRANGGQMIWDGKGYSGNKVSTGVYLVFADLDDGSQHSVTKIIFIK